MHCSPPEAESGVVKVVSIYKHRGGFALVHLCIFVCFKSPEGLCIFMPVSCLWTWVYRFFAIIKKNLKLNIIATIYFLAVMYYVDIYDVPYVFE
jgi:hypothetical protein